MSPSRVDSLRKRVATWIESNRVQGLIIGLIVFNAVILGLETSASVVERVGGLLHTLDQGILTVFVVEIGLKLYARRLAFFRDPWSVFDFVVVGISLIPASGPLAVLRALRVLRVLRLISMVPRLRFVVEALLRSVPGISSIGLLLLVLFYVFGVMATGLFGSKFPDWFGTIAASMYTLFQIMTLESWSMGIVRPVMVEYPYAWLFFVPFILMTTFTMLNLFIGIIVDTMQSMDSMGRSQDHIEQVIHEDTSSIGSEVRALREEVLALRRVLSEVDRREKES